MSTIYIKDIDQHTQLGLYSIDADLRIEQACPTAICKDLQKKSTTRQQETAAVYMLLREMIGRHDFIIEHESSGKPFISICGKPSKYKISISHTKGYAVAVVSCITYVIAGFVQNALICLPIGMVLLVAALLLMKKRTESHS